MAAAPQARAAVVPIHVANSESMGAGYDAMIEVFVGSFGGYDNVGSANDDVMFRFSNPSFAQGGSPDGDSGANASFHDIYFETALGDYIDFSVGSFDYGNQTSASSGVSYSFPTAAPPNPPGILPAWQGSVWEFNGSGSSGVGNGEYFEVVFDLLDAGSDLSTILGLLGSSSVDARIAIHVGNCDGGDSCVIDTWPPPSEIPVPAALPLLVSGLVGLGLVARRRKKAA